LAKECYSMKLHLLTNATVVDDAIMFVSEHSKDKEKLKPSIANNNDSQQDKEESNMPDYGDEEEERLEEDREEETEVMTITSSSSNTNQIF
jgi:hypothetical protein